MSGWSESRLASFCSTGTGGTPSRSQLARYYDGGTIPWVKSGELRESVITQTKEKVTEAALSETNVKLVPPGALLLAMYGATVGRLGMLGVSATTNQAVCHIIPDPKVADTRYLFHALSHQVPAIVARGVGGAQPNISQAIVRDLSVPLPPIDEQRRIVEVLDRAETLRAKRRAALAQLDTLTQSIFLELFGDAVTNARAWPMVALRDVLAMPLRNGLSPSNKGNVSAKVLTLSAVTGDAFNLDAIKTSTFASTPPRSQSVDEDDLLICRGNGNIRLVGKAYFPPQSMPDVTFPDTIIAARIDPCAIDRAFLEHVWNSTAVRRQIESLARTTNGTFKINQTVLEEVVFPLPPTDLQQDFSDRAAAVGRLRQAQQVSLAQLDALFASLQHRAFRGEL